MVFCTYCGNSFTRDEHLERHILTHTQVKPFKCYTCHMSFARRDLLQRHYTVHGRTQSQPDIPTVNGMIPKTAGRTPIACTNCAKTKTKCDKKFPCSRCTDRNLKCTIRPTRRSTKNAERLGLITAETLAKGFLPPDQTVAAEQIAVPIEANFVTAVAPVDAHIAHRHDSASASCCGSVSPLHRNSMILDASGDSKQDNSNASSTPPEFTSLSPLTPVHRGSMENGSSLSGFEDPMTSKLMPEDANPQFMLDWQQFQFPGNFDPTLHNDMFMQQDLGFDMSSMQYPPAIDPAFGMTAGLTPGSMSTALLTPIDTPVLERTFSSAQLADLSGQHSRNPSMISLADLNINSPHLHKNDPVSAAFDGWNVFRCVSDAQSASCPLTARWNLELLENSLKNHDVWNSWTPDSDDARADQNDSLAVMQLHHSTRDKLLAITQGFLHKAMELHTDSHDQRSFMPSSFILLPPTNILEYLLRSYSNGFEAYFPVTSRGALDANELLHCHHDKASSLLVLLMLAQGALNTTSAEAKSLVPGLVETCRISLFDLVERNVHMATDQQVLHGALLFTSLAAWSGDKWQMDIAMGQRGIYTAMLRHARMLEEQQGSADLINAQSSVDQTWNIWVQQESQSRLVYSWAMLDQELALFHDTAPLFSVTELGVPLPHHEALWSSRSAAEWSVKMTELYGSSKGSFGARPDSLRDLFKRFVDDDMQSAPYPLTALHLRLLLHPLQSMVCHLTQLATCYSSKATSSRLDEATSLLARWHALATSFLAANPACAVIQSALALYHVIALNTAVAFDQVELLARGENFDGTYASLLWQHKRCILDSRRTVLHAGQILRCIRSMPRHSRPQWWAAAVYRAGLALWCDSLVNKDAPASSTTVAVDVLPMDHPSLALLAKGEATPCLTQRDGSLLALDHGVPVLAYCIQALGDGPRTRLLDGICAKLDRLMRS